ncbi:hypothetical protein JCM3765_002669 [Sporobolomyces pararoseus]
MSQDPHLEQRSIVQLLPALPRQEYHKLVALSNPAPIQVTLVGAFGLKIHADGVPPIIETPASELRRSVKLVLDSSAFPAYAIPLQIKYVRGRETPGMRDPVYYTNGLVVETECISSSIPSAIRMFRTTARQNPMEYRVVEGPYLALDLIHTHLAPTSYPGQPAAMRYATLTLLLHSLVQMAPDRPSLNLPIERAWNGSVPRNRYGCEQWKTSLREFVQSDFRTGSLRTADLNDFQSWVGHSLQQISNLLEPLLRLLPSVTSILSGSSATHLHAMPHAGSATASPLPPSARSNDRPTDPFTAVARPPQGSPTQPPASRFVFYHPPGQ